MQHSGTGLKALILLLITIASFPFCLGFSHVTRYSNGPYQLPTSIDACQVKATPSRQRPWIRLKDSLIQHVFGISHDSVGQIGQTLKRKGRPLSRLQSLTANPPPNLLAMYGGDIVLRFNVTTSEEAAALSEATNILFLDVWETRDDWVDIRLAKDMLPSLLGLLPSSLHQSHTPLMHDLAQSIHESYPSPAFDRSGTPQDGNAFTPALRSASSSEENLFFRDYQPLSVLAPWMRLLASLFPTHVRLINIGITYEGRDIPAFRIGVHPTNSQQPQGKRQTIIISAGSHAREWISVSTVNYIAYSLITSYGKSPAITKLLERFDWILIPSLNPDGYAYTFEVDRLWRKNRQQTSLRFCRGLDLDRSWGYQWDGETSRGNPCSESYPGEAAFEAVESRRFADWARNETENNNVEFVGFLDLHSYSQQVLYPYSYSCASTPPSLENLEELALGLAKAIRLTSGEAYAATSACEGSVTSARDKNDVKSIHPRMETGGGSSLDWFYHEMQVRYAYQLKLRDTGNYGFLLPRENIVPTGEESLAAVTYFGEFLWSIKGIEDDSPAKDGTLVSPGMTHREEELRDVSCWVHPPTEADLRSDVSESRLADDEEEHEDTDLGQGTKQWELKRRRRRR